MILNGSALRASARSSTAVCSAAVRSSSARKWRRLPGLVEQAGQHGDEGVQLVGRDHQRRSQPEYVRARSVDDEAGVQRRVGDGGSDGGGKGDRPEQTPTAYAGDGWMTKAEDGIGQMGAEVVRLLKQLVPLDHRDHRQPRDGCHLVAAEGAAVAAGTSRVAARPLAMQAPDREPVAEALCHVTRSAVTPSATWTSQQPVRPIPVCTSSTQSRRRRRRRAPGPARGSRTGTIHAVLPLDRLQHHGRHGVVHRSGQGLRVAVGHEGDVAGQRLEGDAVLRVVGDRQRAQRPTVEGALGRRRSGSARSSEWILKPPRWPRCRSW